MNFLRRFFGNKPNSRSTEYGLQSGQVRIDGEAFTLADNIDNFIEILAQQGKGALRLQTIKHGDIDPQIWGKLQKRFGQTSPQFEQLKYSSLVCAGCNWTFPDSYIMSLIPDFGSGSIYGATPGYSEFGKTGKCPQCGSLESLDIRQYFDPNLINQTDVDKLKIYWRAMAQAFWKQDRRQSGVCNRCHSGLSRGEGYLWGAELLCQQCVDKELSQALGYLKKNPYHYGGELFRKARAFKP